MGDASKRQVKFLDREIKRCGDRFWNYTEPPKIAVVTKINRGDTADILLNTPNLKSIGPASLPIPNVPYILPVSGNSELNINVGTRVLVGFVDGILNAPIILGIF